MHSYIIFAAISVLYLSVPVAPLPFSQSFDKRQTYSGRGTWFDDGLGACGQYNNPSDAIVAISQDIYGSGTNCGRSVTITNTVNHATASGWVVDKCMGCGPNDLDMSVGLFEKLGDTSVGVLQISWQFD